MPVALTIARGPDWAGASSCRATRLASVPASWMRSVAAPRRSACRLSNHLPTRCTAGLVRMREVKSRSRERNTTLGRLCR